MGAPSWLACGFIDVMNVRHLPSPVWRQRDYDVQSMLSVDRITFKNRPVCDIGSLRAEVPEHQRAVRCHFPLQIQFHDCVVAGSNSGATVDGANPVVRARSMALSRPINPL